MCNEYVKIWKWESVKVSSNNLHCWMRPRVTVARLQNEVKEARAIGCLMLKSFAQVTISSNKSERAWKYESVKVSQGYCRAALWRPQRRLDWWFIRWDLVGHIKYVTKHFLNWEWQFFTERALRKCESESRVLYSGGIVRRPQPEVVWWFIRWLAIIMWPNISWSESGLK